METGTSSALADATDSLAQPKKDGPRKRRGEHFGEWWQRISDQDAHGVTAASRFIGVTPQSIFQFYTRFQDEED